MSGLERIDNKRNMSSTSLTNECCQNSKDDSEDIFLSSSSYSDDILDINENLEKNEIVGQKM